MADPTVSVATGALRADAAVWERQSETLRAVVSSAEGLRMTYLDAGIFAVLVSAYTRVTDVVSGRCAEGADRMEEIASALRRVADVYDREEADRTHRLTGLY